MGAPACAAHRHRADGARRFGPGDSRRAAERARVSRHRSTCRVGTHRHDRRRHAPVHRARSRAAPQRGAPQSQATAIGRRVGSRDHCRRPRVLRAARESSVRRRERRGGEHVESISTGSRGSERNDQRGHQSIRRLSRRPAAGQRANALARDDAYSGCRSALRLRVQSTPIGTSTRRRADRGRVSRTVGERVGVVRQSAHRRRSRVRAVRAGTDRRSAAVGKRAADGHGQDLERAPSCIAFILSLARPAQGNAVRRRPRHGRSGVLALKARRLSCHHAAASAI